MNNPALGLPTINVPKSMPRPTPSAVIEQGLRGADERVHLMIRLMSEASLRIGEVVLVSLRDLVPDLLGHSLLVHGKGGRERVVLLGDDLAEELISYGEKVGSHWVFPGSIDGHLSPSWAAVLVKRAIGDWSSHSLRHRFGTAAYEGTRDIQAVAAAMGHSSTNTTQNYVRPSATAAASVAAAAAFGPVMNRTDSVRLSNGASLTLGGNQVELIVAGNTQRSVLTNEDLVNLARMFTKHANRI